jgi:hypothetical protein
LYKFYYLFPYDLWTSYLATILFLQGKHRWQQLGLFWQGFSCHQLMFPFVLWTFSFARFPCHSRTLEAVLDLFFLMHSFTLSSIIFNLTIILSWNFTRRFHRPCFIWGKDFIMIRVQESLVIRYKRYYVGIVLIS